MSIIKQSISGSVFLAFPEMQEMLRHELSERFGHESPSFLQKNSDSSVTDGKAQWLGDLLYCPGAVPEMIPYWARTTLLSPMLIHFDSIGEAAKALSEIQRNWAPYQYHLFRRGALIQEKLPYIRLKPRSFPFTIPHSPMGLYTLIDEHTMLASAVTSNEIPAGLIEFEEDHTNPPSRAYLKLQESLTRANNLFNVPFPHEGQRCFDAGACPGGWTWVLRQLGADVLAVDRAELAPSLMADSHVHFMAHDAFTLTPEELGSFDWIFSDVICYPERLYSWVCQWLDSGFAGSMICTIKMQGEVNWQIVSKFAELPDSCVVHLNYNKHELTWIHAKLNGVS